MHPAAWWTWALGLAAAASRTTNPWLLVLIVLVASVTVLARRTDAPWALSFRLYLWLGLTIVVLRVFFRVLFGGGYGDHRAVRAAHGAAAVLGGRHHAARSGDAGVAAVRPVRRDAARRDPDLHRRGERPRPTRVGCSRPLPAALYEVGTALVVALAVFPQLAESIGRVRRARRLRGEPGKGTRGLRSLVVPVLEDALERSLKLARAWTRAATDGPASATPGERRLTGTLLVGGLIGLCVGTYAFLDSTAPRVLADAAARASACCSPGPGSWPPAAGCSGRRTGPTPGGCRSGSPPAPGSPRRADDGRRRSDPLVLVPGRRRSRRRCPGWPCWRCGRAVPAVLTPPPALQTQEGMA